MKLAFPSQNLAARSILIAFALIPLGALALTAACVTGVILLSTPASAAKSKSDQPTENQNADVASEKDGNSESISSNHEDKQRPSNNTQEMRTCTPLTEPGEKTMRYVCNTSTRKFHLRKCEFAKRMWEGHRYRVALRKEAIDFGCRPCQWCMPPRVVKRVRAKLLHPLPTTKGPKTKKVDDALLKRGSTGPVCRSPSVAALQNPETHVPAGFG